MTKTLFLIRVDSYDSW